MRIKAFPTFHAYIYISGILVIINLCIVYLYVIFLEAVVFDIEMNLLYTNYSLIFTKLKLKQNLT